MPRRRRVKQTRREAPQIFVIRYPLSVVSRLRSSRKPTPARSAAKSHSSLSIQHSQTCPSVMVYKKVLTKLMVNRG